MFMAPRRPGKQCLPRILTVAEHTTESKLKGQLADRAAPAAAGEAGWGS